jgi:surface antigen
MKSQVQKFVVESLEGRCLMDTTAFADFNHDGLPDKAVITGPNTITVSLANPDGTFRVSAVLTTPKNQPVQYVGASDINGDGNIDVSASNYHSGTWEYATWLGNGDGTFASPTFSKWKIGPHLWF